MFEIKLYHKNQLCVRFTAFAEVVQCRPRNRRETMMGPNSGGKRIERSNTFSSKCARACNLVVQTKSGVDYLLLYEYRAPGKTQIKTTCNEYRQLGYDTPGIPQKNYTNGLQATEQF